MNLIICEKPSVSAIVAHAVGARERIYDQLYKQAAHYSLFIIFILHSFCYSLVIVGVV